MIAGALAFLAAALAAGAAGLLTAPGARRADAPLLRRLARVGLRVRELPAPRDLGARLDAAGRPGGLGEREAMAAKLTAALAGAVAGAIAAAAAPGRLGLLLAALAPAAGFLAPDLWLARLARERAGAARRELPALLDLLRVTVESGTSLTEALRAVGAEGRGPLAAEWRAAGRRAALGTPLPEALLDLRRRLPLPELAALGAALERSRRHGVPLADALRGQAREARAGLSREAREHAARAAPKIQLVVALLLVPSVLLLVAAALLSALAGSGGTLLPT
ncbi:MAG: type II secretion system F family protein [Thermoleophilaceae bacterium]|nr:type II secretion system F family protein [Thermoleophilaceae bacterium]